MKSLLIQIEQDLRNPNCKACPLGEQESIQNRCVVGRLAKFVPDADIFPIMLVGEAPGQYEDFRGKPFVGPAGALLQRCIETAGIEEMCYITNVVKCRPPNNRTPERHEVNTCTQLYLDKELAIVDPKIIVALGGTAEAGLGFGYIERFEIRIGSRAAMATWHPSAALRAPTRVKENDIVKTLQIAKGFVLGAAGNPVG